MVESLEGGGGGGGGGGEKRRVGYAFLFNLLSELVKKKDRKKKKREDAVVEEKKQKKKEKKGGKVCLGNGVNTAKLYIKACTRKWAEETTLYPRFAGFLVCLLTVIEVMGNVLPASGAAERRNLYLSYCLFVCWLLNVPATG